MNADGTEGPVGRKSVLGVGIGIAIDLEGKVLLGFFGIGDFPSLLCPPHLPSLRGAKRRGNLVGA
jgi:hypothetical protein